MVTRIGRDQVREMVAAGTTLVDVLEAAEFAEEHIAGAINLPLKTLNPEAVVGLDPRQPVIVYCYDLE